MCADPPMWLTESIRLTLFTQPPTVDIGVNWWQAVAGELPTSHTVQRLGPMLQQQGPIRGGYCNLSLQYQPGRIDWVLTPIVPADMKIDGFPNFGVYDGAASAFIEFFAQWIRGAPVFNRLAVGSTLVLPVQDKADGYRRIQRYLPAVTLDPERSADFSYGINRFRQSETVPGLRINRLSRWSVAKLSGIRLEIGEPGMSRLMESPEGLSACRLELDINTQPERVEPFAQNVAEPLLNELLRFGREIVDHGDVP